MTLGVTRHRLLSTILPVAAAYVLTAYVSVRYLILFPERISLLWPAAGILLVALLLLPRNEWPMLLVLAAAGNFGMLLLTGRPIVPVATSTLANILQVVLGASLVRLVVQEFPDRPSVRSMLAVIFLGGVVASAASAFASTFVARSYAAPDFWGQWENWWMSRSLGVALVAPAILAWRRGFNESERRLSLLLRVEFILLVLVSIIVGQFIFSREVSFYVTASLYAYIVLPGLLWWAIRFGTRGVTVGLVLFVGNAIWHARYINDGVNALMPGHDAMVQDQWFFFALVAYSVLITVLFDERRSANRIMRRNATDLSNALVRLQLLLDQLPIGLIVVDRNLKVQEWNPAAERIFGYASREMLETRPLEVILGDRYAPALDPFLPLSGGGGSASGRVLRATSRDGRPIMCEWHVSRLQAEDGGSGGLLAMVEDVTEQHAAQLKIRHLNRMYAVTSLISQAIVRAASPAALFDEVCRVAVEAGGFRMAWVGLVEESRTRIRPVAQSGDDVGYLENVRQGSLDDAVHALAPTGASVLTGTIQVCNDTYEDPRMAPWRAEVRRIGCRSYASVPLRRGGEVVGNLAVYSAETAFFDAEETRLVGQIADDVNHALDVYEREERGREAEVARQESEERFHTVVGSIDDLVFSLDLAGRVTSITGKSASRLGLVPEQLLGHTVGEIAGRDQLPLHEEAFSLAIAGVSSQYELSATLGGERVTLLVSLSPISGPGGSVRGIAGIARDISERKRFEEALARERGLLAQRVQERTAELSAANAELARAARLKDEFLANMSHELRTPLTAILGLSDALHLDVYGPLNERQQTSIRSIAESGQHLLSLINDILDLSKVEAGKMEFQLDRVSVRDLAESCLRLVRAMSSAKRLTVTMNLDDQVGVIRADPRRLKQILVNLLGNAIKFTPEGGAVSLEVQGERENEVVRISVCDNGIGIAAEDLERLFKPFVQLDGGLSRKYEGSGLGLVLVRRLTELHGGGVEVHSSPGKGSRFTVNLPWEQTAGGRKATEHPVTGGETVTTAGGPWLTDILPTVLIVEDDDRTLAVLTEYFRSHRCQILIARTALEALRMIGVQRLDLVLMDIQMPAIDGHAVIQLVREVEERLGHARIPVYAVSSLSLPGDRDRWIAAGASDLFYKPVSLAALSRQLQAHEGSLV